VAVTRIYYWQQLLEDGPVGSGSEIVKRERLHHSTVNELLRLTLLERAMIQATVTGRQPRCMSLIRFQRNPLPMLCRGSGPKRAFWQGPTRSAVGQSPAWRGDFRQEKGPGDYSEPVWMVEVARIELASGSTRQSGLHA
jgi:hypothetical protein